ncbi:septum site-determining protein MinC [Tolypothrix sp. FACHB-123]|uniref:septum site-determining protein MinC n=1 Tax=Tolypothrix sp. FACHB-123 TaxID=2692868 RepID=UPI001689A580|nr:septum site-determining protein MinC [Tolypothrix sp. FACHB-123]MBD2357615.1 septum site-determining protein MinC [Tolypothrix sp. FACHB-123]
MTSDSADLESNSAIPNAEAQSNLSPSESNAILPDTELNSVLQFLKANAPLNADSLEGEQNSLTTDGEAKKDNPEGEKSSVTTDAVENSANPEGEKQAEANSHLDLISALSDLNTLDLVPPENKVKNNIQVQWKTQEGKLLLILPTEAQVPAADFTWYEIWQQMRQRLQADRFRVANTPVHLLAKDRLLDSRQLQELAEVLNEVQLQLKSVATSRRQTAIAAVSSGYSVEQLQPESSLSSETKAAPTPLADALYLEMTVRSGVEIRHPGSVIIYGDLNPGGSVVADGDILVWGRLRGVAHAGASGNRECLIMSLQMEPTQLRIADAVARAPEKSPTQFSPEVAHITPQGIRIARAIDFSRNQLNRMNLEP